MSFRSSDGAKEDFFIFAMLKLSDSVFKLHLVSASGIKALRRLGIETIHDLLKHYPRDWQDLSELKQIKNIRPDEKITFKAVVKKVSTKRAMVY